MKHRYWIFAYDPLRGFGGMCDFFTSIPNLNISGQDILDMQAKNCTVKKTPSKIDDFAIVQFYDSKLDRVVHVSRGTLLNVHLLKDFFSDCF